MPENRGIQITNVTYRCAFYPTPQSFLQICAVRPRPSSCMHWRRHWERQGWERGEQPRTVVNASTDQKQNYGPRQQLQLVLNGTLVSKLMSQRVFACQHYSNYNKCAPSHRPHLPLPYAKISCILQRENATIIELKHPASGKMLHFKV